MIQKLLLQLVQKITSVHDLAKAFNEMLGRLEDSFRRLSDFSSDLAHEIRTPISNLMTQTQVAASRGRPADEYRAVLYSNLKEYERLARMIADTLNCSSNERNDELHRSFQPRPVLTN